MLVQGCKTEAILLSPKEFIGPLRPILYGTSVTNHVKQNTRLDIIIDNKRSWENS